jgi:hypothetical protein
LQIFGDSNNSNATGNLNTNDPFDVYFSGHKKVDTSSGFWNNDYPGGNHSGAEIHSALDEYNNFGSVEGVGFAHTCDHEQFVALLSGFSVQGDLFIM